MTPCATPTILSTPEKTGAFRDWRGQVSWGRICALVALVVAVILSCKPAPDVRIVALWLAVATGNYSASKLTEITAILKGVGSAMRAAAPSASGGVPNDSKPQGEAGTAGGDQ